VVSFVTPDKAGAIKKLQRELHVPIGTTEYDLVAIEKVLGPPPPRRVVTEREPDRHRESSPNANRGGVRASRPFKTRKPGQGGSARNGGGPRNGSGPREGGDKPSGFSTPSKPSRPGKPGKPGRTTKPGGTGKRGAPSTQGSAPSGHKKRGAGAGAPGGVRRGGAAGSRPTSGGASRSQRGR
jgi:hypothetical protein